MKNSFSLQRKNYLEKKTWRKMRKVDINSLRASILKFRNERDWVQFHKIKNLIVSLNLEASELLELTQWKDNEEVERLLNNTAFKDKLGDECADILIYLLLLEERAGLDLLSEVEKKLLTNEERYPVLKSFGSSKKYTQLGD